jgi:hypothetical protein
MGVWNWNNPMLAGVQLSLFCQFWQQYHVPQIGRCVRSLGTIIGSPVKLLCPNLGDAMIEVRTKPFLFLDQPPPSYDSQAAKKMERHEQNTVKIGQMDANLYLLLQIKG